jgi:C4-type Zn-finger protein
MSEQCVCGRDGTKLHCPACGRFACYAKSSKSRIEQLASGGTVRIMTYHCRGCGIDFDDLQRARCEAPRRGLSMAAVRAGDKAAVSLADLPPEERKEKLRELFAKKVGSKI